MPSGRTSELALADWLARIERLHPSAIELGLERIGVVAARLDLKPAATVITVGGTNGKGSTCALLESILRADGYRVGTYTSPHLVDFNERARIDGESADDAELVRHFEKVESARQGVALTYFEFSTLAILSLFSAQALDAWILEVGLGGRLDAVNIIDADCSIVTCVDVDHTAFLGETREQIGFEKAHIYRRGRPAVCSDPSPPASLLEHAASIGADLWLFGRDFDYAGDRQQWSYRGRAQRRNSLAYPAVRGANQLLNASGALAALESLRERLPVSQQAVREGLARMSLPGRFQSLPGRPAVVLDVAHNPHAARHLASNLQSMGFFGRTFAVFGVMADKDVGAILDAMVEVIDHWIVVGLDGTRAADSTWLAQCLVERGLDRGPDHSVEQARGPVEGLQRARVRASDDDRIVVFGSFLTVAAVLAHQRAASRR